MTTGILLILLAACLWLIVLQQSEISGLQKQAEVFRAQLRHPAMKGIKHD